MARIATGRIEVGTQGGTIRIRVSGRATHLISQPLREFSTRMVRQGHREFFVELADCVHLDSTFAGVLAGLSLRLKDLGGTVTLLDLPPRCAELLATLGIDSLFATGHAMPAPADAEVLQALPSAARSQEAWAGTILEAHRLLAEADRANASGFGDVVEYLEADAASRRDKFRN